MLSRKIAIIGSGNMGEALLGGLLKAKLTDTENVIATDVRPERLDYIKEKWSVQTTSDNA
jgi:pyrroline-5-carboxylate reductase